MKTTAVVQSFFEMKTKQNLSEQQEANFKLFQGFLLSFKTLVERYKEAFKFLDLNDWSHVKDFINVSHFLLTEYYLESIAWKKHLGQQFFS